MSQRLTRKEMKRDEFANVVGRSVEYAESHTRGILLTVGAVALAVAIGFAVYGYLGHRAGRAQEALSYAMKVYAAPIEPPGGANPAKPQDPKEPSFPSESARQARAKELFTAVRRDYGFSDAAAVAGIYLAEIEARQGHLDAARQLWSDFVKHHGKHMLAAEARLDLIALDRQQGKGQQVAQELRAMLDQPESPLPQDVALFELAKTLEALDKGPEAIQTYQRILDEFPQSAYRQDAQQRMSALDPSRAGLAGGLGGLGGAGGFPGAMPGGAFPGS
jgi:tetratricopeptide (TPR) repeat protein